MSVSKRLKKKYNNQFARDEFVISSLAKIEQGKTILDAGAGSQRYRSFCNHLTYKTQDFGEYKTDVKVRFDYEKSGQFTPYEYGPIDFLGDIRSIDVPDETFDAVLCTEVLEHVSHPIEAVAELHRVLKPGGVLILTFPSNCLRHFDPHFYTSGLSDRWVQAVMSEYSMEIVAMDPVGDYYSWMATELVRTMRSHSFFAKLALMPSLAYYSIKRPTQESVNTLCMGYHVVAVKKAD